MTVSSHTSQEQKIFRKKVVFRRETACSIFLTVRPKRAPYSYSSISQRILNRNLKKYMFQKIEIKIYQITFNFNGLLLLKKEKNP